MAYYTATDTVRDALIASQARLPDAIDAARAYIRDRYPGANLYTYQAHAGLTRVVGYWPTTTVLPVESVTIREEG